MFNGCITINHRARKCLNFHSLLEYFTLNGTQTRVALSLSTTVVSMCFYIIVNEDGVATSVLKAYTHIKILQII